MLELNRVLIVGLLRYLSLSRALFSKNHTHNLLSEQLCVIFFNYNYSSTRLKSNSSSIVWLSSFSALITRSPLADDDNVWGWEKNRAQCHICIMPIISLSSRRYLGARVLEQLTLLCHADRLSVADTRIKRRFFCWFSIFEDFAGGKIEMHANMLIVVIFFLSSKKWSMWNDRFNADSSIHPYRENQTFFESSSMPRVRWEQNEFFFRESNLSDIANRYDMYMNITKIWISKMRGVADNVIVG